MCPKKDYVEELAKILDEYNLTKLEVTKLSVTLERKLTEHNSSETCGTKPVSHSRQSKVEIPEKPSNSNIEKITSPMVGTLYAAPGPDEEPYVSLNQKISKGQVVCIVEAMKLMNEIESEYTGRVAKICVENGSPVEFGQELFYVEIEKN